MVTVISGLLGYHGWSGPQIVMATGSKDVLLIQWQPDRSGSGIRGTLTLDAITGTPPRQSVSIHSIPFTGKINGGSVALKWYVEGGKLGTADLDGTLSGNTLKLTNVSSLLYSGFIAGAPGTNLQQSSRRAYNAAVAVLRSRVRKDNAQAAAPEHSRSTPAPRRSTSPW